MEEKIAELSKHIAEQARFTRIVVLMCTAAIMGVLVWMIVEAYTSMPGLIAAELMNQLPKLHAQWQFLDQSKGHPVQ
jgi:hypothetical protein